MSQREYVGSGSARSSTPRRTASPVAALQNAVGNRGMTRALGRKPTATRGTFEVSVRIGDGGPIEVKESNVGDWVNGKSGADDLVLTTVKGKHSDELKRLSDTSERIGKLEVQTLTGQNSWITVTFEHGRIRGYAPADSGKTERWTLTRFDAVHIDRLSIGKPRA